MNCDLWITFITTTHSDHERSRVGIQFYEEELRLTTFLEMLIRLTVPFSFVDQSFYEIDRFTMLLGYLAGWDYWQIG